MNTTEQLWIECLVKAKQIVANKKAEYGGVDLMCFDDPPAAPANESTDSMLQAYIANYPGMIAATQQGVVPLANANLLASQTTSPAYAQLQAQLLRQYAPEMTAIGNELNKQTALANAASDLAVLGGPGKQLVQQSVDTAKIADPEYYAARAQTGNQLANLLSSINVNGFTPTESRELQGELTRQNAARGNLNNPSQLATLQNAAQFGSALQGKREALANILNTSANTMPTLRSGTDVFQVATGRPSMPNFGQTQFTGVQKNNDSSNTQLAGGLLNNISAIKQQEVGINSQRMGTGEKVFNGLAGGCCFIFMEAYNGTLPWFVRRLRDDYYKSNHSAAIGYKRLANVLVPLMASVPLIRSLVNQFMIIPLTQYGGYISGYEGFEEGKHKGKYLKFWLKTWSLIGKL